MLVVAEAMPPRLASEGDALDVELRLPGGAARWLTGRLIRIEPAGDGPGDGLGGPVRLAVGFDRVSPDDEDAIEDAVVAMLAATRTRPVAVLDEAEGARAHLADALRDRAMTPVLPRTPLELVTLLESTAHPVEVCVLGASFANLLGRDLASVLTEAFPWVRVMHADDDAGHAADRARRAWDEISGEIELR